MVRVTPVVMPVAWMGMAWLSAVAAPAVASGLRCDVSYAGVTRQVVAMPVQDPYGQAPVDIADRFLFKPVVVGSASAIERVNLYVYLNTRPQPVLLQQAKYLPPFAWPADGAPLPLTGRQYLYGGPAQRELIYSCALYKGAP